MRCDANDFKEGDILILPVDNRPHRIEELYFSSGGYRVYKMEKCPSDASLVERAYFALESSEYRHLDYRASPSVLIGNRRGKYIRQAVIHLYFYTGDRYRISYGDKVVSSHDFSDICDSVYTLIEANPNNLPDFDIEWTLCLYEHEENQDESM